MTQLLMIYTTQHRKVLTDTKIWWNWSYGYVPSSQWCPGTGKFLTYASKSCIAPHIPGASWRPRGLILQSLYQLQHRTFLLLWGTLSATGLYFYFLVNTGTFQRAWTELGHTECFSGHLSEGLSCRSSPHRIQQQGEHVSLTPTNKEGCQESWDKTPTSANPRHQG